MCTLAFVFAMIVFRIATVPYRGLLENYWHNAISSVGFKKVCFTQCFPKHYKNFKEELLFFTLSTRPTGNFDTSFSGMKMHFLLNTQHHVLSYCWARETFYLFMHFQYKFTPLLAYSRASEEQRCKGKMNKGNKEWAEEEKAWSLRQSIRVWYEHTNTTTPSL